MHEAITSERKHDTENSAPESLDALLLDNPDMEQVLHGQEALQSRLGKIESSIEQVHKGQARLMEIQQTLDVANQELSRLSDLHWQQHIITPMAQQIFPIFDLAIGLRSVQRAEGGKELEVLKAIQSMLLEFLETYGITLIRPIRGKAFDSALMQAAKVIPTSNKEQDKRVHACVQAGFRWNSGTTIRPASVHVLRWQPQEDAALTTIQS